MATTLNPSKDKLVGDLKSLISDAEELLKRRNLPANGALRQRQLLRRARKALVARGRLEGDQQIRSGEFSAHGISS